MLHEKKKKKKTPNGNKMKGNYEATAIASFYSFRNTLNI